MVRAILLALIGVSLLPIVGYAQDGVQQPEVKVMPYDGHTFGVYDMVIEARNIRCDIPVTRFAATANSAAGDYIMAGDYIGFWVTNPYPDYKLISVFYEPSGAVTRDDGTFYAQTPDIGCEWVTIYGLQQTGSAEPWGYNIPPHTQVYIPFSFIVPGNETVPDRWAFSIAVREITLNSARVGYNPTVYIDMWQPVPWYSNTLLWAFLAVVAVVALLIIILTTQKAGRR